MFLELNCPVWCIHFWISPNQSKVVTMIDVKHFAKEQLSQHHFYSYHYKVLFKGPAVVTLAFIELSRGKSSGCSC